MPATAPSEGAPENIVRVETNLALSVGICKGRRARGVLQHAVHIVQRVVVLTLEGFEQGFGAAITGRLREVEGFLHDGFELGRLRAQTIERVEKFWINPAEATEKFRAKYSNRLGKRIRLSFAGTVKHANDDEIDINGNDFTRDFENFTYKAKPSIRFRLSKRQALSLAYSGEWSEYAETSGQESLDWWAHGPAAQYRFKLSDAASLRVVYGFTIRNYDENLASLKDGTNLATNPSEKHHYQRVDVKGTWRPVSWLELDGGYRFKTKEDQFEGFESYEERKWKTGLTLSRFPPWTLRAEGAFSERQYDNRLGELATETLEYDKLEANITAYYKVKYGFSFYAHYSYANRDSNRSSGSSYRDYSYHRFLTGFSFAR